MFDDFRVFVREIVLFCGVGVQVVETEGDVGARFEDFPVIHTQRLLRDGGGCFPVKRETARRSGLALQHGA